MAEKKKKKRIKGLKRDPHLRKMAKRRYRARLRAKGLTGAGKVRSENCTYFHPADCPCYDCLFTGRFNHDGQPKLLKDFDHEKKHIHPHPRA